MILYISIVTCFVAIFKNVEINGVNYIEISKLNDSRSFVMVNDELKVDFGIKPALFQVKPVGGDLLLVYKDKCLSRNLEMEACNSDKEILFHTMKAPIDLKEDDDENVDPNAKGIISSKKKEDSKDFDNKKQAEEEPKKIIEEKLGDETKSATEDEPGKKKKNEEVEESDKTEKRDPSKITSIENKEEPSKNSKSNNTSDQTKLEDKTIEIPPDSVLKKTNTKLIKKPPTPPTELNDRSNVGKDTQGKPAGIEQNNQPKGIVFDDHPNREDVKPTVPTENQKSTHPNKEVSLDANKQRPVLNEPTQETSNSPKNSNPKNSKPENSKPENSSPETSNFPKNSNPESQSEGVNPQTQPELIPIPVPPENTGSSKVKGKNEDFLNKIRFYENLSKKSKQREE